MVKLVFLGRFRDIANPALAQIVLPGEVRTLGGLKSWLAEAEPALGQALESARTQIAVNQVLVRDPAHPIANDDEIAFLPPMSGG
jgi:molybdopterin synthase sulfur carrier subunit